MKYAYNKDKLLEILPQFNERLRKLPRNEASCLWQKINIYFQKTLRFGNGKASFSAALSM